MPSSAHTTAPHTTTNQMRSQTPRRLPTQAIKGRALDLELGGGELVAARDRAVADAARMAARLAAAEAETAEHR